MSIFVLIILSCYPNEDTCATKATYFQTEEECGRSAQRLADRLAAEKPKAKVTYFCYRQEKWSV
jgi:hypothetical protein